MFADFTPSRLAFFVAIVVLRLGVVWRIVALRMTSAGWIGSKLGRAACAGWMTGPRRLYGAAGIAADGENTRWEFPNPVGMMAFSGTIFSWLIISRMPVALVREDGHGEEDQHDQVDELHRVCRFKACLL